MTDKEYRTWIKDEYLKKKQTTIDALRSMSVDDLSHHLEDYRSFTVAFIEENDAYVQTDILKKHIERHLKDIDDTHQLITETLNESLIKVMFAEEMIVHLIEKQKQAN